MTQDRSTPSRLRQDWPWLIAVLFEFALASALTWYGWTAGWFA